MSLSSPAFYCLSTGLAFVLGRWTRLSVSPVRSLSSGLAAAVLLAVVLVLELIDLPAMALLILSLGAGLGLGLLTPVNEDRRMIPERRSHGKQEPSFFWLLVGLLVAAAALRIAGLDFAVRPGEQFHLQKVRDYLQSPAGANFRLESWFQYGGFHPGWPYTKLVAAVSRKTGLSVTVARAVSIAGGLLLVFPTLWLGKLAGLPTVERYVAVAWVCLSPVLIGVSRWAQADSLFVLVCLTLILGIYFFLRRRTVVKELFWLLVLAGLGSLAYALSPRTLTIVPGLVLFLVVDSVHGWIFPRETELRYRWKTTLLGLVTLGLAGWGAATALFGSGEVLVRRSPAEFGSVLDYPVLWIYHNVGLVAGTVGLAASLCFWTRYRPIRYLHCLLWASLIGFILFEPVEAGGAVPVSRPLIQFLPVAMVLSIQGLSTLVSALENQTSLLRTVFFVGLLIVVPLLNSMVQWPSPRVMDTEVLQQVRSKRRPDTVLTPGLEKRSLRARSDEPVANRDPLRGNP